METSAPLMNEKTKFLNDVNLFKLIRFNDIPFNIFLIYKNWQSDSKILTVIRMPKNSYNNLKNNNKIGRCKVVDIKNY